MTKCLSHVRDIFIVTCLNFNKMFAMIRISQFMIVFACSWFEFSYVSIRTKCFNNWFIFRFRLIIALHIKKYSNFDEMFWQTIYISQFLIFVTCSNFESYSHAKIVFDVRWIISLACFIWLHMFENAFINVFDQKLSVMTTFFL